MSLYSSTLSKSSLPQWLIDAVWAKAQIVPNHNPNHARKDRCGAWIVKSEYGKTTDYGWEIDHIIPKSLGGSDDLSNLQPLHWQNNRTKGDNYPNWSCSISARL